MKKRRRRRCRKNGRARALQGGGPNQSERALQIRWPAPGGGPGRPRVLSLSLFTARHISFYLPSVGRFTARPLFYLRLQAAEMKKRPDDRARPVARLGQVSNAAGCRYCH